MSIGREIRARVEAAGGRLETTVRELRDAFGLSRLTKPGRQRIVEELRRAKLRVEPPLDRCQLDDPIAIVDTRRKARRDPLPARPPSTAGADSPQTWVTAAKSRFASEAAAAGQRRTVRSGWTKRRGVIAGAVVGVVVILIAAAFGSGGDEPSPAPREAEAVAAGEQNAVEDRTDALTLIAEARALIAADDPQGARQSLSYIAPAVLAGDAGIEERVAETRRLAGLTARYLDAERLANRGSYLAARDRMQALVPFRDARARSEGFATQGARVLVGQARDVYIVEPGRALGLLRRAEAIDPDLASIEVVRELALDQQTALAAPPEPAPAPIAPAAAACDPNYSGACIPNVSYDLNCGDVSASNFASIGSDPHGFDREGDGVACEG